MCPCSTPAILRPPSPGLPRVAARYEGGDFSGQAGKWRAGGVRWAALLVLVSVLLGFASAENGWTARITELRETTAREQVERFFRFEDPAVRHAVTGSVLLGICCGLMGAFLVVRRLSLMGDALGHAVLPGVVLGYLWNMSKDPWAIFIGATVAGLLGAGVVQWIRQTTRHKEDAALGFVLASFFGVGICLLTMVQNLPGAGPSGLDDFLFGQAAAMGEEDLWLLGGVTLLTLGAVGLFFKEFTLTSFDPGFARALGWPTWVFHYALMLLLAFAIVASLQAVGVVLVSAMLVIPAAAAYLLTPRFGQMLLLAAIFGALAGACGSFFSFVGRNFPTGPVMVLSAGAVFTLALFLAPRHGILVRWLRQRYRCARVARENSLKAIYHLLEAEEFQRETVSLEELAQSRRQTLEEAQSAMRSLVRHELVTQHGQSVALTPKGWQRAAEIVRNHRLWELYLTHAAHLAPDHVHEDAEKIEHILGEETVLKLEKRLNYARRDPHGRLIPGLRDIRRGAGIWSGDRAEREQAAQPVQPVQPASKAT